MELTEEEVVVVAVPELLPSSRRIYGRGVLVLEEHRGLDEPARHLGSSQAGDGVRESRWTSGGLEA